MKTSALLIPMLAAFGANGQIPTTNLLANPGGETGDLTGGTVGGPLFPSVVSTNPPGADPVPPHLGRFVFKGGPNPNGSLQQKVVLADYGIAGAQVDSGRLSAHLSFWQRSRRAAADPPPVAMVTLVFRDAQGTSIEGYLSTPALASLDVYTNYQARFEIPAGTRSIDYLMGFATFSGTAGDSYIDDNSLTISDDSATETVAPAIRIAAVDVYWASRSNILYQVEYRSTLTTNLWTPLGDPVHGTGGTNCVTDTTRGQTQRFYRVRPL